MSQTSQTILDSLKKHRLVADEKLAAARQWLTAHPAPPGSDESEHCSRFTQWLVEQETLTPFQLEFINKGRTARLRMGDYLLIDRIGVGRMAGVYKARKGGQRVAIKILPPDKAKDEALFARFQREGRLAARLKHPNVVRTFDIGEADGLHYIVMEYLAGETLEEVLERRGKLSAIEVTRLFRQALEGLQHLHEQDVVHRDLKPANLMLTAAGVQGRSDAAASTLKILDVGLGRTLFDDAPEGQVELTEAGDLLGTVGYMAPEQARDARQADLRSDLYSLGCVFYHALTGQPPFVDKSTQRVILMHATQPPKPVREADSSVPAALAQVIDKLLIKDPAQRIATPKAAIQALDAPPASIPVAQAVLGTAQAPKKTGWLPLAVAGIVAVAAVVVVAVVMNQRSDQGVAPPASQPSAPPPMIVQTDPAESGSPTEPVESAEKTELSDLSSIRAALRDPSDTSKALGASALGKLGAEAKSDLGYLRLVAQSDAAEVRDAAEQAIAALEPVLIGEFIRDLDDSAPDVRRAAALELGQVKSEPGKALPNLIEALSDKNSAVRVAAMDALVMIGPEALPVLVETLKDKSVQLRQAAITCLGRLGPDAKDAVPALVELASDAKVAKEVQAALEQIGPYAIAELARIYEEQKSPASRKVITEVLARIGPEALPTLKKLGQSDAKVQEVAEEVAKAAPKEEKAAKPLTGRAALYETNLRGWFNLADRNRDESLDRAELALAIKNAHGSPFQSGGVDPQSGAKLGGKQIDKNPAGVFLARLDRDGDGAVGRGEYDPWARDFAVYQAELAETQEKIADAERRLLAKNLSQAARLEHEAARRGLWANYYNLRRQTAYLNQMDWLLRQLTKPPR